MSKRYSNPDSARRAAVAKACGAEWELVREGKETRDWTASQQAEILSAGRCKDYCGHHKFSVKNHPELAGEQKIFNF